MPRLSTLAVLFLCVAASAAPASVRTPHVELSSLRSGRAVVPGEPLTIALRLAIIPGWHTYWRNPGDRASPRGSNGGCPPGSRPPTSNGPCPSAFLPGR